MPDTYDYAKHTTLVLLDDDGGVAAPIAVSDDLATLQDHAQKIIQGVESDAQIEWQVRIDNEQWESAEVEVEGGTFHFCIMRTFKP
jgi:hypothetical protein